MTSSETGHPALTDERTGLPNRLQFDTVYRFLFAVADRGVPLTLLMVEVDSVDEPTFREAADRLAASTRSSDLIAHLGDGRFAMLLVGCNLYGARTAADRVAVALEETLGDRFAVGTATHRGEIRSASALLEAVASAVADARAAGGGLEIGQA